MLRRPFRPAPGAPLGFAPARPATAERLERRRLLTVALTPAGLLDVDGGPLNDAIAIGFSPATPAAGPSLTVTLNGSRTAYPLAAVRALVVDGRAGDDVLCVSDAVRSRVTLIGGDGDDVLRGGAGPDVLLGGNGNDTLDGTRGGDGCWGGPGIDTADYAARTAGVRVTIDGRANDGRPGEADNVARDVENVAGGSGDDYLAGGTAANVLRGNGGDDTLVAVGGTAADVLLGGTGSDAFWCDAEPTERVDADPAERSAGLAHRVGSFQPGVPRDCLGQDLPDPPDRTGYVAVGPAPLFAAGGPTAADVHQGGVGDCYFLAGVGAVAAQDPGLIRRRVVELGDGTYAVEFHRPRGGQDGDEPAYVRVDGDLPASGGAAYAGRNGSVWARVMEKAYASFRTGAGTYDSLAAGWMSEAYEALGLGAKDYWFPPDAGRMFDVIAGELGAGNAVTFATGERVSADSTLVGGHAYIVVGVNRDATGAAGSITVRNPWAVDAGFGMADADPYDGVVTIDGPAFLAGVTVVQVSRQ